MSDETATQSILGKKIFFLYPTTPVQNQIITELIQHEYEVYIVRKHARLLNVLKKYPDSIIFANIDEGMNAAEWERWVGAFHTAMPEIKIGVFSSSSNEELQERYLTKHHISCGFMSLKLDMSRHVNHILEMLNVLNAKGRRKYLRAAIENEPVTGVNIAHNGEFIKGSIKDISVVGFACILDPDPGYKKNELVKDIQIKLQSMLLKVEAVVFGSREENGERMYVLLFTQKTDPELKVKIRKYIQTNLQRKMDAETN